MRTKDESIFITIKKHIEIFYLNKGISPTIREIAKETGIQKTRVHNYLIEMNKQGLIDYFGRNGIETDVTKKLNKETTLAALVGDIVCGEPTLSEENIEEYFKLPTALVGCGNFFLLKAKGQSMIDAKIDDGDLVLVKQQNTAEPGQIIVALINDENTLKRYYPDFTNNRIRLHPENKNMKDFYVENLYIQGIAVKVFKNLI